MNITAKKFREHTGKKPVRDDLIRCNCRNAGKEGHQSCGWDHERDMPVFIPGESLTKKSKMEITHRENEVAMSHEAYRDLTNAWQLLKQLSIAQELPAMRKLIDKANQLPGVPGGK